MSKKHGFPEDYEELRREIVRDKVQEVFEEDSLNYREGLEEIGFTWFDDEYPSEEDEEAAAVPFNETQELLVAYFDGCTELSDVVLDALRSERRSESPNYPLIRKYFRGGNPRLKNLLLYALEKELTSIEFLADLSLFHEFNDILTELIAHFTKACQDGEQDPRKFSELALEFHCSVKEDGYDALLALGQNIFDHDSDKRKIVDFLAAELSAHDKKEIPF